MLVVPEGCSDWVSNFKKDPVAQTQSILTTVQTVVDIATMIFKQALTALPKDKVDELQKKFDDIVLVINNSKTLLMDGLEVAKTAGTNPTLGTIVDQLTKGVVDLQALVNSIKATTGSKFGAGSGHEDDLDKAVHTYQKFAVELK
jgi:hypothetical protein